MKPSTITQAFDSISIGANTLEEGSRKLKNGLKINRTGKKVFSGNIKKALNSDVFIKAPNKYRNNLCASHYNTLPGIKPHKNELKNFFKSADGTYVPLLATDTPQRYFTIQKWTGKETERYLTTKGCSSCSILTIYDPVNKVGFIAHVDRSDLPDFSEKIKNRLLEEGAELQNLEVRHIGGDEETVDRRIKSVYRFMDEMGLKRSQLVEENVIGTGVRKGGVILDLSNGQTYDFCGYYSDLIMECDLAGIGLNSFQNFRTFIRKYGKDLNPEEKKKLIQESLIIHDSNSNKERLKNLYKPSLFEAPLTELVA